MQLETISPLNGGPIPYRINSSYCQLMNNNKPYLFVFGGYDDLNENFDDKIYILDIENKNWLQPRSTGIYRNGCSCLPIDNNGNILIVGGILPDDEFNECLDRSGNNIKSIYQDCFLLNYNINFNKFNIDWNEKFKENIIHNNNTNNIDDYDNDDDDIVNESSQISIEIWEQLNRLERHSIYLSIPNNRLYISGGFISDLPYGMQKNMYIFDLIKFKIIKVNFCRKIEHEIIEFDNKIWSFGGLNETMKNSFMNIQIFDLIDNRVDELNLNINNSNLNNQYNNTDNFNTTNSTINNNNNNNNYNNSNFDNINNSYSERNGLLRINSSNSNKNRSQNLAQFKRHSIADISNINMYNENAVFETHINGRRNYLFEQQKQNRALNNNNNNNINNGSDYKYAQVMNNIDKNGSYVNTPRIYIPGIAVVADRKKDHVNEHQSKYLNNDDISSESEEKEDDDDNVDDNVDDNDSINLYEDDIDENNINYNGTTDEPALKEKSGFAPMRTQQRRLMIKEGMEGFDASNTNTVGASWLHVLDKENELFEGNESNVSNSIPEHLQRSLLNTATSVKERNQAAHVTSQLRSLALHGQRPFVAGVERVTNFRSSHVKGSSHVPKKIVLDTTTTTNTLWQMWDNARRESPKV
ncbi:hypothetical protein C6P42_000446 [Pichia californica]|nr:hypothetical protein C6P42_000446 [[Candida] californica]